MICFVNPIFHDSPGGTLVV